MKLTYLNRFFFEILGVKKNNKVYFIYALDFGVTSFEVVPLLNGRGLSRPNRVKYCSLAAARSASSNISASFLNGHKKFIIDKRTKKRLRHVNLKQNLCSFMSKELLTTVLLL